ncbi:MAG: hypothetical protein JKY86_01150 [Gammaproteobacteria bacterium]|nr:hypothetical protein [Gammaproteobacteria bacterium]
MSRILRFVWVFTVASLFGSSLSFADDIYVKGGVTGGDGSIKRPFGLLSDVEAASAPGDVIYIKQSKTALNGGITLQVGQKLIGLGPDVLTANDKAAVAQIIDSREGYFSSAITLSGDNEVANVLVTDTYGFAVLINETSGNHIHHSKFDNIAYGFGLQFLTQEGEIGFFYSGIGVYAGVNSENTIDHIEITKPKGAGISFYSFGEDSVLNINEVLIQGAVEGLFNFHGFAYVAEGGDMTVNLSNAHFLENLWGHIAGFSFGDSNVVLNFDNLLVEKGSTLVHENNLELIHLGGTGSLVTNITNSIIDGGSEGIIYSYQEAFGTVPSHISHSLDNVIIRNTTWNGIRMPTLDGFPHQEIKVRNSSIYHVREGIIVGNTNLGRESLSIDLGTAADPGNNRFFNNGVDILINEDTHVQAVGNWWGSSDAIPKVNIRSYPNRADGTIDTAPVLASDPQPEHGESLPLIASDKQIGADRLLVYYSFDELVDGVYPDGSKNGYDGELVGNVTSTTGVHGDGARIDGNPSYINLNGESFRSQDIPVDGFTIGIWAKLDLKTSSVTNLFHMLFNAWDINNDNGAAERALYLWGDPAGSIYTASQSSDYWPMPGVVTAAPISPEVWHHYTYTYSRDTGIALVYLDGIEIHRREGILDIPLAGEWELGAEIGHRVIESGITGLGQLQGSVDEFVLYNYALSPEKIAEMFNEGTVFFRGGRF